MDASQIRQIQAGLIKAGAIYMPYFRRARDGNGVAAGEPEHIGCILGLKYQPNGQSQMRIDIPGIVMHANSDQIEGVITGNAPHEGDSIRVGGVKRAIVSVMQAQGCLYTLVLADE